MAFSIKQVKAILSSHNIPVDELDKCAEEICSRHTADLDSIKEERDNYKKDAETLVSVQAELDKFKQGDSFEDKYNALKTEYDNFKNDVEAKETKAKIKDAYKELLKSANVSDKRLDTVLKVTDFSAMKLDKDGKLEGADELTKSIKTEWADFIAKDGEKGADPANPPKGNPSNPGSTGRARELAKQYHANLYGAVKEGD